MTEPSIQERLFPNMTCFGCGPANPKGFHLRSFGAEDGVVIASFTPWPEHDNGVGFLNGGVISTVLDCHTASLVVQAASERGWDPPPGAALAFVTAGLDVRFLRPTPLGPSLDLWAKAESLSETECIVLGELRYDGKVRATVRATWKRFRAR
ncbi:PaaI family thioesterase [Pendulispora brunnea]|uniref:PaaI family thioesterase n=1 Tax=Pendulispora brunnea TaxID=2905690 RepID=A0ABZ2K074_9BACT